MRSFPALLSVLLLPAMATLMHHLTWALKIAQACTKASIIEAFALTSR